MSGATGAADGVEELAASILAHGLLQPWLVSPRGRALRRHRRLAG